MSMERLLARRVLVINKKWRAVDETTVAEALCDMCSGKATGIDMENHIPVKWEDWLKLTIRDGDDKILSLKGAVRVPTVVGKFTYAEMPKRSLKLDNRGIALRDGKICQVTGEYAPNGNVDHPFPVGLGGERKSWENMVWMRSDFNSKKACRTLEQMGWKLIRKPFKPKDVDAELVIEAKHPDWEFFLPKVDKSSIYAPS